MITQAATGLSSVAAAVIAHAQTTAPAKSGAVLFWEECLHQHMNLASASAVAPSLARSAGEGWGGVASASASAPASATAKARAKAFSPLRGASYFSLLVQRKDNQKKAHPASAPTSLRDAGPLRRRDFSTIHPCIVEKRRASCTSPHWGSCPSAASLRKGPGRSRALEQRQQQLHPSHTLPYALRKGGQLQLQLLQPNALRLSAWP